MRVAIALGITLLLLWLVVGHVRANRQIEDDKRTIADLTAKQAAWDETPSFDLQSRCAETAKEFFKRSGYSPDRHADYMNHFNPKLKKCFIVIKTSKWNNATATMLDSTGVFDAVEGKSYGEYVWQSDKGKKYWEVAPLTCSGTKLDGSYQVCHSEVEFTNLMADYMDIDD